MLATATETPEVTIGERNRRTTPPGGGPRLLRAGLAVGYHPRVNVATLAAWQRTQAVAWLTLGVVGLLTRPELGTALATTAAAALLSLLSLVLLLRAFRLADLCTSARVGLLAAALLWASRIGAVAWPVWAACVVAVVADLVDGAVARRRGPTAHGAVLDMEADQLATTQLAVLATVAWDVAPLVLVLPGFRLAYVLLGWLRGLPAHDPKPKAGDNRRARVICAGSMTLLLVTVAPSVPSGVRLACVAVAATALAYSFADDFVYLLRRRRAEPTP